MNEQLNKLIEQYPGDKHWVKVAIKNLTGSVWEFDKELVKFLEFLASRPTCGVEQRKFLDVIERKGKFDKTNLAITVGEDGDSVMLGSDFYLLDVGRNQKDYVNLEEVIKGE